MVKLLHEKSKHLLFWVSNEWETIGNLPQRAFLDIINVFIMTASMKLRLVLKLWGDGIAKS